MCSIRGTTGDKSQTGTWWPKGRFANSDGKNPESLTFTLGLTRAMILSTVLCFTMMSQDGEQLNRGTNAYTAYSLFASKIPRFDVFA